MNSYYAITFIVFLILILVLSVILIIMTSLSLNISSTKSHGGGIPEIDAINDITLKKDKLVTELQLLDIKIKKYENTIKMNKSNIYDKFRKKLKDLNEYYAIIMQFLKKENDQPFIVVSELEDYIDCDESTPLNKLWETKLTLIRKLKEDIATQVYSNYSVHNIEDLEKNEKFIQDRRRAHDDCDTAISSLSILSEMEHILTENYGRDFANNVYIIWESIRRTYLFSLREAQHNYQKCVTTKNALEAQIKILEDSEIKAILGLKDNIYRLELTIPHITDNNDKNKLLSNLIISLEKLYSIIDKYKDNYNILKKIITDFEYTLPTVYITTLNKKIEQYKKAQYNIESIIKEHLAKTMADAELAKTVDDAEFAKTVDDAEFAKTMADAELAKTVDDAKLAKTVDDAEFAEKMADAELAKAVEDEKTQIKEDERLAKKIRWAEIINTPKFKNEEKQWNANIDKHREDAAMQFNMWGI